MPIIQGSSVALILPDDPEECRLLLVDLLRRNDELRRVLEQTVADYSDLQGRHAELTEVLALLRRYIFGPRRERHVDDPGQGHLFNLEGTAIERVALMPCEPDTTNASSRPARPRGRNSLDHLPHIRVEHDLPKAEKTCPCCGERKRRIGEDHSRELEFIPAKLEVRVHVLPQYACPKCRDGVASPPLPPSPCREGSPGPAWSPSCLLAGSPTTSRYTGSKISCSDTASACRGARRAIGTATPPRYSPRWPNSSGSGSAGRT
jgi:hypothetical protein